MKVEDEQKYIKRSTAAQWGVQKPYLEYIRDLQEYRCTVVWGEQENVARVWWQLIFSKKGPRHVQLRKV